jgi:hypothetical protein
MSRPPTLSTNITEDSSVRLVAPSPVHLWRVVYPRTSSTDVNGFICTMSGYRPVGICQAVRVTFDREGYGDGLTCGGEAAVGAHLARYR